MRKEVVKKVETNLSALSGLLGEDNVENIKKRIGDLIVDRVREDLRSYNQYLFYPEDYEESINKSFEKIEKKIAKMYSDAMLETAEEAVRRFKDISLTTLNDTSGLKLRNCHKCKHCNFNKCEFYDMHYWKAHDSICAEEGFKNFVEKEDDR